MPEDSRTLYERLGGEEEIVKIVFAMYKRVMADPELAPFFENVPIERLGRMNAEFISSALDGPITYSGADLVAAHRGRGIELHHFSKFVGHLAATLEHRQVDPHDIDAVLGRIATYAGKITGDANVDG
jgi:hemoglobin